MIRPLVPSLCVAIFAMASTLHAGVLVSLHETAPNKDVSLTVAPTANTLVTQWRNHDATTTGRRDIGQTFKVDENLSLKSVTFRVGSIGTGAPNAEFTLNIYRFEDQTSFTPSGSAIYTASGALPASIASNSYLTLTLDEAASLSAGNYYGIVLSFTDWATQRRVNFFSGSTSLGGPNYGVPLYYQYSSDTYTWTAGGNALQMYLVAVPEPRAAVLMGVPFVLLGGMVYRKRMSRN